MSDDVSRKLAAARTKLVLDKPFLGALVLRLPLRPVNAPWCPTTATDARAIYYNPAFIESLNLSQVQFVLSHDALHCGLSHFARREHRDSRRWDIACDHTVNLLLKEDKLEPPEGSLYNDEYQGLSAEEIFPLIPDDSEEQPLDNHLYDQHNNADATGQPDNETTADHFDRQNNPTLEPPTEDPDGKEKNPGNEQRQQSPLDDTPQRSSAEQDQTTDAAPPPLSNQEREQLKVKWQQRLAGAAQQASQSGKMSGSATRLINQLLRSSIPWRNVLARYMSGSARVDYNLTRPSQRREGDAIMPSLHTRQTHVIIALDTSGSIEDSELDTFVGEINAIKSLVNARITVLACDSQLDDKGPWVFESWEQLALPKTLKGYGGTDFRPVFEWIEQQNIAADLLVYFTDAKGRFPTQPSSLETLWLIKGSAKVPWGQRIQLN